MAKTSNKAVTTRGGSNAAIYEEDFKNLPDFMRSDVGKGQDRIDAEDIETPRIKLMQGLSPEVEAYNGLRPGMFFHVAAEHVFSEGTFRGVPIYYDRRYMLWNPRDSGGGILARADDGIHWSPPDASFTVKLDKKDGGDTVKWSTKRTVAESGLARWGSMNPNDANSPPAATRMLNFLLMFPDLPELGPAVLTYQRSSIKMGRRLNSKLKTIRAPMFACVFEFSAFKDTNSAGQDYYNIDARGVGLIRDAELYQKYKDLNEQFTQMGLNIQDMESLQDDAPPDDGEGDDGQDEDDPGSKGARGEAERGSRRGGATKPGQRPRY